MPALRLFGRKTLLGGDDLQPAVLVALVVRLVQLIVLLYPLLHLVYWKQRYYHPQSQDNDDNEDCETRLAYQLLQNASSSYWLGTYACLSATYIVATLVLDQYLAYVSSTGAPTETHPRQATVARVVQFKLGPWTAVLLLIWVVGMTTVGTAVASLWPACLAEQAAATRNQTNTQRLDWETTPQQQDDWVHEYTTTTPSTTYATVAATMHNPSMQAFWRSASALENDELDEDPAAPLSVSIFVWIALVLLLVTQFAEICLSWMYVLHLLQQPRYDRLEAMELVPTPSSEHHQSHHLAETMWAERCAAACRCVSMASCFLFGGQEVMGTAPQDSFAEVARALADYLETRGVLDVVPSDIVTGLVLLQRVQRQRIHQARRAVLDERGTPLQAAESGSAGDLTHYDMGLPPVLPDVVPLALVKEPDGLMRNQNGLSLMTTSPVEDTAIMGASRHQSVYRMHVDGKSYQQQQRSVLSRHNPNDLSHLEEGARYAKFALAIYTWVLYLYVHPISGPARLVAQSGCGCRRRRRGRREFSAASSTMSTTAAAVTASLVDENGRIEGDNICETHKAALLLTAGLEDADLVYAQLKSSFRDNPYCILLDHKWQCVVVSIRGTFSLEDCVTDVLIDPESLEQLGLDYGFDATDQYCHGGVLACVSNIYRDLERHGLLSRLLLGERAPYADYSLRLVGHSLGAASCTILSYMLQSQFPTLRCVNYSPPGCSLTWEMATGCKGWTTTFVLDSDLVPRLSLDSMARLRDGVLEMIGRAKVPKIQVAKLLVGPGGGSVRGGCLPWFTHLLPGSHYANIENGKEEEDALARNLRDMLHAPNQVPASTYQAQLGRFQAIQEQRKEARGYLRAISLYPSGRIIHLTKTGERKSCLHGVAKCLTCCTTSFGSEYVPVWINNDDLNEIVVSPTMGTDHFPNRMQMVLEGVADDFGLESFFA